MSLFFLLDLCTTFAFICSQEKKDVAWAQLQMHIYKQQAVLNYND